MYLLIKVEETLWSARYDRNKTYKQSNDAPHPDMGKIKPFETRAHPPPSHHLRRKQDEAISSSRWVKKDQYRNKTRERHKPFGGLAKTNERILTAPSADDEGRRNYYCTTLSEGNCEPQNKRLQGQAISQQGKSQGAAALRTLAGAKDVVLYPDTA